MSREDILSILREYKKQSSGHYGIVGAGYIWFATLLVVNDAVKTAMSMWSSGFKGQTFFCCICRWLVSAGWFPLINPFGEKVDIRTRRNAVEIVSYRENL